MKSRITKKFQGLKEENKKALITYVTAGDPDLDTTYHLVLEMERAGADIIELGIPYSDPLADGPVIQRAAERALKAGANITSIFQLVAKLREKTQIPLVFLVYYNCVFKYGMERFLDNCRQSGIDGLVIPDLPLEERKELQEMMKDYPIDLIPLVAPTSEGRIEEIVKDTEGFIYCISSTGVTGTRQGFEINLDNFLQKVRKYTDVPLALGFGISTPEMIESLKHLCDGLIVGSAIIEKIEEGIQKGNIKEKVYAFTKKLDEAKNIA
ncbi:tryptophan synthase subunit alpha [Clostridium formicaceticum]|uniref:Tryptophan synthase alpha chain n=1 Tax=Clostridium formicaceticum TaxID=1497 RepID=A0AAC9RHG9_9CLOT|nr:tryptophan synthase subunit alpha [Clostridium formicaceticum]AOY75812.1 tryptophan synthase subunit alpha [Clostridium formicaceticum]ARE86141.1 Tryptophan synthase alpha chain [Clostridium formicaceticum]